MKSFINRLFKLFAITMLIAFLFSISWVILYKFVDPPLTVLMVKRMFQHDDKKGDFRFEKDWVDIDEISPNMVQAVVAAEDNNFMTHFGVDWEAIQKAKQINKHSRIKHGASTITQQTAKNVFLFPSRTYFRKGLELYFTFLIEICWSKERIMEVYLNVIEMGRGIYGVQAASEFYYKKSAKDLSKREAAMFAAILPSPLKRNPAKPSGYMRYFQGRIIGLMDKLGPVELN